MFEAASRHRPRQDAPRGTSPPDSFFQQQVTAAGAQTKELFELSTKVAQQTFESINSAATKTFEQMKKQPNRPFLLRHMRRTPACPRPAGVFHFALLCITLCPHAERETPQHMTKMLADRLPLGWHCPYSQRHVRARVRTSRSGAVSLPTRPPLPRPPRQLAPSLSRHHSPNFTSKA